MFNTFSENQLRDFMSYFRADVCRKENESSNPEYFKDLLQEIVNVLKKSITSTLLNLNVNVIAIA